MLNIYKIKQKIRYRVIYKDKVLDYKVFKTIKDFIKVIIKVINAVKGIG